MPSAIFTLAWNTAEVVVNINSAQFAENSFKDKKLWVVIARKNPLHEEFFTKVRTASGDWTVKRTNLGTDATRLRMLEAMIEDGLTEEEIKEHLGEISEIERKLFFPTIKEEEA